MLVKFSNPGSSYTVQCDSVSVEVSEHGGRVRVLRDGGYVHDGFVGVKEPNRVDGIMYYERAYIMENGVTVDTIK